MPSELLKASGPVKSVYSASDAVTALIVIVNGSPAICSPMLSKAKAASGSFTVKLLLVPLTPSLFVAVNVTVPGVSRVISTLPWPLLKITWLGLTVPMSYSGSPSSEIRVQRA